MNETMEIIHGPTAPEGAAVIYQVTMPQGLVLTKPSDFGSPEPYAIQPVRVIAEDGRLLTPDANAAAS